MIYIYIYTVYLILYMQWLIRSDSFVCVSVGENEGDVELQAIVMKCPPN